MTFIITPKNEGAELTIPLTDAEIRKFKEKVYDARLPSIRDRIKDALDIIHFTIKYFIRHNMHVISSDRDATINAWDKIISDAMLRVDAIHDIDLEEITDNTNYVQDAFKLVETYLQNGVLLRGCKSFSKDLHPNTSYLRKVLDIYRILCVPTEQYIGSDIAYSSDVTNAVYPVYSTKLPYPNCVDPTYSTILTEWADKNLKEWANKNLKCDIDKDEFYEFVRRHKSDITNYAKLKHSYPYLNYNEKDKMRKFFVRWFLKEQSSK